MRRHITVDDRRLAAELVVNNFIQYSAFKKSKHIACYLAYQDEFETELLIRSIWQENKICYLPILMEDKTLEFARYNEGDPLSANQFSILEPQSQAKKISPEELDLVIVPLIAFDNRGIRLGTGGGYYDRTFSFLYGRAIKKPLLIGLGFSAQQCESNLPSDHWDIPLDAVLTEKGIFSPIK